jgi:methionine-rich copper-binding protein CopC
MLAVLGALLAGLVVLLVPTTAHAESAFITSDPAPQEEVNTAPGWVTVVLDRDPGSKLMKVIVLNSAGHNVGVGDLIDMGSSVMVQLIDKLPKGTYTVMYQYNRGDGEPEGGAYQFAYGKGEWTAVTASWSGWAQQPAELKDADPSASPSPSAVDSEQPSAGSSATPGQSAAPAPGAGGVPSWIWWTVGAVGVVAVGGGSWAIVRTRRGRHGADQ